MNENIFYPDGSKQRAVLVMNILGKCSDILAARLLGIERGQFNQLYRTFYEDNKQVFDNLVQEYEVRNKYERNPS